VKHKYIEYNVYIFTLNIFKARFVSFNRQLLPLEQYIMFTRIKIHIS